MVLYTFLKIKNGFLKTPNMLYKSYFNDILWALRRLKMNLMSYKRKYGNYAFLDKLMAKEVEMNKVCF